jgi:predicted DNA binding CopG/RHH family protein
MKAIQYFSDEYLEQCSSMTPDQVLRFLDEFRRLHGSQPATSKLISMKVPEDLLGTFKAKARLRNIPYQTQIKILMKAWVLDETGPPNE